MLRKCVIIVALCLITVQSVRFGFGGTEQDWGYVTVRPGAHMFWWLYYTQANVKNYTDRPLVIWLQGGPGASSTGYGNFEEFGPLDLDLEERNFTWVKDVNVLFIDNPVGSGYSYVDNLKLLTTNNEQIARDLIALIKDFYKELPEFKKTPLHIYSESYGGKMAVEFAYLLDKAIKNNEIECDLKSVGLVDSWISPIDSVLSWAEFLLNMGFVDTKGFTAIQASAIKTQHALIKGEFVQSTILWGQTENVIVRETHAIDFYNVMYPQTYRKYLRTKNLFRANIENAMFRTAVTRNDDDRDDRLNSLMNGKVKVVLEIPEHVKWGGQSNSVFSTMYGDFMKPVTNVVELLLNNTNIEVAVITGQLDLIVATPGTIKWVENLNWAGRAGYLKAPRDPIAPFGILEGYQKSYSNLYVYWANRAGHMVPFDNPVAMDHILQKHTKYNEMN
uniref:Carboxypeptidase n=1 Tax=Corethrella appendiculata TaxID=1370023 RepID=U5EQW7_9DIPT